MKGADGKGSAAALSASFLGWTLDAFDFFLVAFCLTAIAKEFGESDKAVASSLALTLAFRPVGAFLFGLLADRYGRRLPLDDRPGVLLDCRGSDRLCAELHRVPGASGALWNRYGRRVGRRRVACDGEGARQVAWAPLGASAARVCARIPARCGCLSAGISPLRLAAALLFGRVARAAGTLCARACDRVGDLAELTGEKTGAIWETASRRTGSSSSIWFC